MAEQESNKSPLSVHNKEAYDEFLSYRDHPLLQEVCRFYVVEDPDGRQRSIDLWSSKGNINRQTATFAPDKREEIVRLAATVEKLRKEMFEAQQRAYTDPSLTIHAGVGLVARQDDAILARQLSSLETYKEELIALFGQFYEPKEVLQTIQVVWGIKTSKKALLLFVNRNQNLIQQAQMVHTNDFSSVRLAHKKSRLLELSDMFNSMKRKYELTQNRDDYKLMLLTLEQVRKEADGSGVNLTINNNNVQGDILLIADSAHMREALGKVSLLEVVVGRVASRLRLPAADIMSRLRLSTNNKWTQITDQQSGYIDEFAGVAYDMNLIREQHKLRQAEELTAKAQLDLELTAKPKQEVIDYKAQLDALIAKAKMDAEQASVRLQEHNSAFNAVVMDDSAFTDYIEEDTDE